MDIVQWQSRRSPSILSHGEGPRERNGGADARAHYLAGNRSAAGSSAQWDASSTTHAKEHEVTDVATTIDTYLAAYNDPDPRARLALVAESFATSGRLIDPPLDGSGHAGISAMMGAVQQQFPGHALRRVTGVDEHHGHFRYGWELVDPGGAVVLAGEDVGELDGRGQLVRVTGFFGALPERD
jgi:hypothetical protein